MIPARFRWSHRIESTRGQMRGPRRRRQHTYFLAPALAAAHGVVVVDTHDRLRRLRHVLRRVRRPRRRLEVVVCRVHGAHLLQVRRLVHHIAALVHLQLLAQLEVGVGGDVLLLLLRWRAAVLVHEHGGASAGLVVSIAIRNRRGHGGRDRAGGRGRCEAARPSLGRQRGAGHGATRVVLRASNVLWRLRVLSRFTLFGTSVAGTGSASSSSSSGQAGDGMAVATSREGSMLLRHAALHADLSFAKFHVVAVRTNLSFREAPVRYPTNEEITTPHAPALQDRRSPRRLAPGRGRPHVRNGRTHAVHAPALCLTLGGGGSGAYFAREGWTRSKASARRIRKACEKLLTH
jgi:hypothetical protein